MNRKFLLLFLFSVIQGPVAQSSPSRLAPVSSYLSDPSHHYDAHAASTGSNNYIVPAELATLIETRTIQQLLAAIILDTDNPTPVQLDRIADLTVIVLSRVKPTDGGWMSEEDRRSHAKNFQIAYPIDRALRRGFPGDAAGWRGYYKKVATNSSE